MHEIFKKIPLDSYNCEFIDIRIEEVKTTFIMNKNSELENANELLTIGAFIRIKLPDKWVYKTLTDLSIIEQSIRQTLENEEIEPFKDKPDQIMYQCHERLIKQENLLVFQSIQTKKQILDRSIQVINEEAKIINNALIYKDEYVKKYYISTKGIQYVYDRENVSVAASYTLKEGENVYNTNFNHSGHLAADFDEFENNLRKDIQKACLFINAPTVEPGKYTVILSEIAAGIFAHESFGHKSEADFMLGDESMIKEWEIGKKTGSDILSIVDEGDIYGLRGYIPFDDEGNPAQKTYLIQNGILKGRLHSDETAKVLNEAVTGNARAISFFYEPIVRMSNTYIEAGTDTFESLIEKTDSGFYIENISHGSGLSTFTLAVNRAWRIDKGKITDPVKINLITGTVFQTLKDIDGLSNEIKMISSTLGGCGKNQQWPLPVSYGGPKVRVKEMMVS